LLLSFLPSPHIIGIQFLSFHVSSFSQLLLIRKKKKD